MPLPLNIITSNTVSIDNSVTTENDKPLLNEMWEFIDSLMRPNNLVPDKSVLSYEEVFAIYSKLVDLDQTFREILQINLLKRAADDEIMTKNSV